MLSKKLKKFISDSKGAGEWNALYMVLIGSIVVIVLLAVVKPMFSQSASFGTSQEGIRAPTVETN